MKSRTIKRHVIAALALGTILSCFSLAYATDKSIVYADTTDHWARESIGRLSSYEILLGSQGKFRPNDNITRGEMAVIIDRIMGYQRQSGQNFSDLDSGFYRDAILRANTAGVINGDTGGRTVRPKDNITRQEASVMLCRAFHIDEKSLYGKFTDDSTIPDWSRNFVGALASRGYINGDTQGRFKPYDNITRAEVAAIIDRMLGGFVNTDTTKVGSTDSNVVVRSSNAELKDITIGGDLILAEGVQTGSVTLNNVKVNGTVLVYGGGDKAVKIKGNTTIKELDSHINSTALDIPSSAKVETVNINFGNNFNFEGKADTVSLYNSGMTSNISDANINYLRVYGANNNVNMSESVEIKTLQSTKDAKSLRLTTGRNTKITDAAISGENTSLNIDGKITTLDIKSDALKCNISVNTNARVSTLTLDAEDASVSGSGKLERINANADNANITTKDTRVYVSKDADNVKIDNKKVKPGSVVNSSDVTLDLSDWDDEDYETVQISSVEVIDQSNIRVILNKQIPVKLDKKAFTLSRLSSGSNTSIYDYDYSTSGSNKYKVYTLSTSNLTKGDRYEIGIELPNGDDIYYKFYAEYIIKEEQYPELYSINVSRTDATTGTMSWSASRSGTLYYIVQENNNTNTPPANSIKNYGKSISIGSGSGSTRIDGLVTGKAYNVYMVSYYSSTSYVYGPYALAVDKTTPDVPNPPEQETPVIQSFARSGGGVFEFSLSKSITEDISSSVSISNGAMTVAITAVETNDRRNYTVRTSANSIADGTYTLTVTFADKKTATKSLTVADSAPVITLKGVEWESDSTVAITIDSNVACTMRYILGKSLESVTVADVQQSNGTNNIKAGEQVLKFIVNKNEGMQLASVFVGNNGAVTSVYLVKFDDAIKPPENPDSGNTENPDNSTGDNKPPVEGDGIGNESGAGEI